MMGVTSLTMVKFVLWIVLTGSDDNTTFKDSCAKHGVTYNVGTGYIKGTTVLEDDIIRMLCLNNIPQSTLLSFQYV